MPVVGGPVGDERNASAPQDTVVSAASRGSADVRERVNDRGERAVGASPVRAMDAEYGPRFGAPSTLRELDTVLDSVGAGDPAETDKILSCGLDRETGMVTKLRECVQCEVWISAHEGRSRIATISPLIRNVRTNQSGIRIRSIPPTNVHAVANPGARRNRWRRVER